MLLLGADSGPETGAGMNWKNVVSVRKLCSNHHHNAYWRVATTSTLDVSRNGRRLLPIPQHVRIADNVSSLNGYCMLDLVQQGHAGRLFLILAFTFTDFVSVMVYTHC